MNYIQHKEYINYIKYMNEMQDKKNMNYMNDMQYMKSYRYKRNFKKLISEIKLYFLNSNYEILSAHIYCINFNIRCFPNYSEKFINTISNFRIKQTIFNKKFKEYRNHFYNKKGILKYLNEDQYLILKEY